MSELRAQLQSLREDYRRSTYPGDLAANVGVGGAPVARTWWLGASALSGLAAAIVVVVVMLLPGTTQRVAQWTGIAAPSRSFNLDLPALPSLPSGPEFAYRKAGEFLHNTVPHEQIRSLGHAITSAIEQLIA